MLKKTQNIYYFIHINVTVFLIRGRRGRDRSWIYNYLCNQYLSPLKLGVRTPFMAMCTHITICDKVCQRLATCLNVRSYYDKRVYCWSSCVILQINNTCSLTFFLIWQILHFMVIKDEIYMRNMFIRNLQHHVTFLINVTDWIEIENTG